MEKGEGSSGDNRENKKCILYPTAYKSLTPLLIGAHFLRSVWWALQENMQNQYGIRNLRIIQGMCSQRQIINITVEKQKMHTVSTVHEVTPTTEES